MGDATYQETSDEENQVEVQENDPEEMEGAEHPQGEPRLQSASRQR